MYFRIKEDYALRSWKDVKYAFYVKYLPNPYPLTVKQADVLLKCDGEHDMDLDDVVQELLYKKIIASCEKGEHPSSWSSFRKYENICFPRINLTITGKCNYNCLHCFNAADNAPIMTEWSLEELHRLLDEAEECGVHAFTITGGEPMLHKNFMNVVREIYSRNMIVDELNTNGFYITQGILDQFKEIGAYPQLKISFDGIGYHDWMRNSKGAEKKTLDAIRLSVENGFPVVAQTQANRTNVDSLMGTAKRLNEMGVMGMRIIRTTETPRWRNNAPEETLSLEEYYSLMLDFCEEYIHSGMNMDIIVWLFIRLYPARKSFRLVPVNRRESEYRDSFPACQGVRGMVALSSEGEFLPCMQASGYLKDHGIEYENFHATTLKTVLTESHYLDIACRTVGDVKNNNSKCGQCKYFKYCTGGCRALGLLYSGEKEDSYGEDITKCYFFENGWYEKVCDALKDWKNAGEIQSSFRTV